MTDTKAKLTALLESPFDGYRLTERQKTAATWAALGYSQKEIAKLMDASPQLINYYLVKAAKKIGIPSNRGFAKHLIRQIKLILEMKEG